MSDCDNKTPEFLAKYATFPIGKRLTLEVDRPPYKAGDVVEVVAHAGVYSSNGVLDFIVYDIGNGNLIEEWEVAE